MEEMLGVCQRPEVGAVGAKLIYPDHTIQHAGCVVGMGGIAGHMFVDMPADRTGYLHKASLLQDMSAVTAACMMMKKKVFEKAGGFTEELAVAFNDVDLCLKVRKEDFLIVYDPYAELYHMESKTRGAEDSEEKVRRFQTEIEYMRCHWLDILKKGLSAQTLARLFALSAEHRAQTEFEKKLAVLTGMVRQGELPFDASECERAVSAWRAAGFPPCHHSETFRQAYAPAYRLMKAEYAPLLPLLSHRIRLTSP